MSHLNADGSSIKKVSDFGLPCCQVVSWDVSLCTKEVAQATKKACKECGVRPSAFWAGVPGPQSWDFVRGPITLGLVPPAFRWARMEALKNWADFAAELGAPAIITHCGFLPENLTDPEFVNVAEAIREVAYYCKNLGLEFWFETGQETPVTLLRYIEHINSGNLGINLDPANILMYGKGNPIDALDVFGKYVKNVHAKDGKVPSNGFNLGPEVKVGEGMVRYPEFIKKLLSVGFEGDLIIEREIQEGDLQNKDIKDTIKYLNRLLPKNKVCGKKLKTTKK